MVGSSKDQTFIFEDRGRHFFISRLPFFTFYDFEVDGHFYLSATFQSRRFFTFFKIATPLQKVKIFSQAFLLFRDELFTFLDNTLINQNQTPSL